MLDLLKDLPMNNVYYSETKISLDQLNTKFSHLFVQAKILNLINFNFEHQITVDDFIPNSITINKEITEIGFDIEPENYMSGKENWGKKII